MLGAGVFAVWAPAADVAGNALILAVAIAAVIALINALSMAQLAVHYPVAGGAYVYGKREVHPTAGFIAGIGFVVGKTASVAAMGLAIGQYAWPEHDAVVATAAIVVAWALNVGGISRTAKATTVIGGAVLLSLLAFMGAGASQPGTVSLSAETLWEWPVPILEIGTAAGLVFFAFAGYARIASLSEEVREPHRTIPRAMAISLALVLAVYAAVGISLVRRPGVDAVAGSAAPLVDLVEGSPVPAIAVTVVAAVAAFGAMVALGAGIGRTIMAMARERDLPTPLARQGSTGAPWLAEAVACAVAIALAWFGNVGFALAMSSFAVLVYYAVANLAAARARAAGHVGAFVSPRGLPWVGLVLCVGVALCLPIAPVVSVIAATLLLLALRWLLGWLRVTRQALPDSAKNRD
jgi:APA family basic amino acid/polyamine antiporter